MTELSRTLILATASNGVGASASTEEQAAADDDLVRASDLLFVADVLERAERCTVVREDLVAPRSGEQAGELDRALGHVLCHEATLCTAVAAVEARQLLARIEIELVAVDIDPRGVVIGGVASIGPDERCDGSDSRLR